MVERFGYVYMAYNARVHQPDSYDEKLYHRTRREERNLQDNVEQNALDTTIIFVAIIVDSLLLQENITISFGKF